MPDSTNFARDDGKVHGSPKTGSGDALGELVEMYRKELTTLAKHFIPSTCRSKLSPADAVQNALVCVLEAATAFHGSCPAEFRAWLRSILLNSLRDFLRRECKAKKRAVSRETPLDSVSAQDRESLLDPTAPVPLQAVIRLEIPEVLQSTWRILPEIDGAIIRMHYIEELPFEEIGSSLNMSSESVRKRCARGLRKLSQVPKLKNLVQD